MVSIIKETYYAGELYLEDEMTRYPSLKFVSALITLFGFIIGLGGISLSIYMTVNAPSFFQGLEMVIGIGGVIFSLTVALIIVAHAEFLQVIMHIEENTRNSSAKNTSAQ